MKRKPYLTPRLRTAQLVLENALLGKSSSISTEKANYKEGHWDDVNEGYY